MPDYDQNFTNKLIEDFANEIEELWSPGDCNVLAISVGL